MAVKFGIHNHDGLLTESVGTEKKAEVATLRGSNGQTKYVKEYDRTTDFNLKTRGEESALALGSGDPGIATLTGGVTMINSIKYDESNTDFPTAEVSGTNYPDAVELTEEE